MLMPSIFGEEWKRRNISVLKDKTEEAADFAVVDLADLALNRIFRKRDLIFKVISKSALMMRHLDVKRESSYRVSAGRYIRWR